MRQRHDSMSCTHNNWLSTRHCRPPPQIEGKCRKNLLAFTIYTTSQGVCETYISLDYLKSSLLLSYWPSFVSKSVLGAACGSQLWLLGVCPVLLLLHLHVVGQWHLHSLLRLKERVRQHDLVNMLQLGIFCVFRIDVEEHRHVNLQPMHNYVNTGMSIYNQYITM